MSLDFLSPSQVSRVHDHSPYCLLILNLLVFTSNNRAAPPSPGGQIQPRSPAQGQAQNQEAVGELHQIYTRNRINSQKGNTFTK